MRGDRVEDVYPLTPLQRGMLFHTVLAPEAGDYLAQISFVLEGPLDEGAFERSWQAVIQRHPALRTAFVWKGVDEPVQVVLRDVALPFACADWRDLDLREQRERLDALLAADRRQGFDLARAPLMRVHLARLSDQQWRVTWTSHHLLLDGWSVPLVVVEALEGHSALAQGRDPELQPVRPYRDYIAWLQGRDPAPARSFWRERLRGVRSTPLHGVRELPRTSNERALPDWGDVFAALSVAETELASGFARRNGLTLATIVQAAWALLLAHQTGEGEVLFGVARAGRPAELDGVESMVGMFVNTLPLRVELPWSETTLSWLKLVQARTAELAPYEWSALTDVASWCGQKPGTSLFESLVVFENYPLSDARELSKELALLEVSSLERTNYPVNLIATPGAQLSLRLSHDPARMDSALAERWLKRLRELFLQIVQRPGATLSSLPPIDEEERRLVLEDWARGPEPDQAPACIGELFEAQVDRTPQAIAVECEGESLTYLELDAAANRLARALAERGIGRENLVGLCLERTAELAIGILGIAKAGAAWLPLDPDYPPSRLAQLAGDAQPHALLTDRKLLGRMPSLDQLSPLVVLLEDVPDRADRVRHAALPESLAYVIYTSGSTGAPKGVEVSHRGLGNLARETARAAGLGPGRKVLQLSSIGFDVSVLEILSALLSGSTLSLLGENRPAPGRELAAKVRETGAHVLLAPPSVLRELDPAELPSVETVFSGGEPCTAELSAAWNKSRHLINAYGPAESTVTAAQAVGVASEPDGSPPSIGRPLSGVRAYVLAPDLGPAPAGSVGELFLGGIGVARGYRGRRAHTAERFLPDPFAGEAGARIYRTGDLARWRPLATGGALLEFCGRADRQLKIRGVRVEPGEVEAALLAHPDIRQAAVDAVSVDGEKRLAAWFAPRQGVQADASALRRYLAECLPPALVPSFLLPLQALPLTPNGKLDRASLPEPPEPKRSELAEASFSTARSRTPVEELVCLQTGEVLGQLEVAPEDDFFALGGHSLRAMQLVSRLRVALGVDLPLRDVFAAPTLGDLASTIEALRRGGEERREREIPEPIAFAGQSGPKPLSFAQQRLWFLDRFEPESPLYVVPAGVRLEGKLDANALERALEHLVNRHAALRTRIEEEAGEPRQSVQEIARWKLQRVDLRDRTDRELRAREIALEEARRPFNLGEAPLVRASLLQLEDERHVLLLALHHAAADGWSLGILLQELAKLYEGASAGAPLEAVDLPALPLSYADYACWQRDPRVASAIEQDLAFWESELAGAPSALELPTDRPRPPIQTFSGRSHKLAFEAELFQDLSRLARKRNATPFMVLVAAFQVWLSRLTGQDDVVVGVPVAGRNHPGLEGLIGLFVNTLPLRGRLEKDPSFLQHLERTRERVLAAWDHQDAPFERLVERLTDRRDLSRPPLVQVLFVMQDLSVTGLELRGLRTEVMDLDTGTAKFDLSLLVDRSGSGSALELTLEYNTDLLEDSTARAWLMSFLELLRSIAADPGRRVSELEWLPAEERELLLESWGRAGSTHPQDATVPSLFAAQVARTPDAVAVAFGESSLSYRELDARSNQLARRLRALGVGPEERVALGCERSLEMVVAMLAVLKAGGAYVPLDPLYPTERRQWMLAASLAPILLVQRRLAEAFPAPAEVRTILVDGDEAASESSDPLPELAGPLNLAYLMYTSGSTGVPKGVGVSHRAISRLLTGEPFADLGPAETVLQFVSTAFDVSVFEIWGALLHGARLEVFPPHLPSLAELGAFVRERGVTTLWLTTGLFNLMVEAEVDSLRGVRQLLAGGEALSAPHVERALRELPGARVINGYGPTEVTCFTTTHDFPRGEPVPTPVPIGRPINGTGVYVLDRHLRAVPRGVRGELYAAGDGLARGYLNDSSLTAERFVPDPFAAEAGGRLYKIGDQARWRSDGTLEFCGRSDRQVKVRGYRVELGEIEAALSRHPAVHQCVVELRGSGDAKRPVAWIATRQAPSSRELRDFLRSSLPEPVLPAFFVALDELPLTPNGKVDRRALPDPEARDELETQSRLSTPEEELLAGQWQDLLGRERIGVEDDFFELGGHSLLATRLVARIRDLFGVDLPLKAVFEQSRLADLAQAVAAQREREAGCEQRSSDRLEVLPVNRASPLPLSFAQERLWFLERYAPGNPAHHTPLALELSGELDAEALRGSLEILVRRHEALRTCFSASTHGNAAERGAGPAQSFLSPECIAFELPVEDLSELADSEREESLAALREAEMNRPFDLERDLLLRARLARLSPTRHVLLLCLHHIASDGWSLSVLMRELSTLYGAALAGREPALPSLPLQYADHACAQRNALSHERLQRELEWWQAELDGAGGHLELGRPSRARSGEGRPGAGLDVQIPPGLAQDLERLGRREGATLFMVLLAGFQALLARSSGRDRLIVGSPIAGRTVRETEQLVGPFVNLLALRADLRGNPTFAELLARTRETTLAAYAHAEMPVERLAHILRPEGNPRGGELFQVTFTFHNTPPASLELSGVTARRLDVHTGVAFGELWLSVEASPRGGMEAYWHYDAGLFGREDVERLATAWLRFLERAVHAPQTRLSELALLSSSERAKLIGWGTAPSTHPRDATVPSLFEQRARLAPEAVALSFEGASLTYRELSERSNQLANYLRALGVGPEVAVAVACERSLEQIVALLGILKAGGAYAPLDPAWPEQRMARALELCGAPLLLTQERLLDELPSSTAGGPWAIALDSEWQAIARASAEELELGFAPDHLAYVMFTSGSTGEPKAVAVQHRSIVRLLAGEPFAPILPGEGVLQLAPLAFDASTFEIWGTLLAGGRLEIFPPRTPSLAELGAFIQERGITTLWLTAGLFHQMIDERADDLRGVRQLLAGGEALSIAHVARTLDALPRCRLVNGYGPTELTTFTCCHAIAASMQDATGSVPIGRPINGTAVYVLDPNLELVPPGAWGELCASGDGLARGYLGDPRLTAERFAPDPFSREAGARLFRTGDRVRWREDGTLEFGGRLDRQIKLRGFRIEPSEIEAALDEHPSVRGSAVELIGEEASRQLGAWIAAGGPVDSAALRAHLRSRLPEYMVPAFFAVLDHLPLTANGKVDRTALPRMLPPESAGAKDAPRTPEEELLAGLFAELLGREVIARDDDFFDLGGHSLLATQLASRVNEIFGVSLPLHRIFESPTPSRLSGEIAALRHAGAAQAPLALDAIHRATDAPLSFGQERLWFLERLAAGRPVYHAPFAIELRGPLDVQALRMALGAIARRHESLRTAFPTRDGRPCQVIAPPPEGPFELPVVDLSNAQQENRLKLLERQLARAPFDLAAGPLFRVQLVQLDREEHVLLLCLHHIVCDGWSLSVFTRELSEAYRAEIQGCKPELAPLPIQVADHATWQRAWMSGERLERELAWWREELDGVPERIELVPRGAAGRGTGAEAGAVLEQELPAELALALERLARREGATLFMVLLAAFQALLGRISGSSRVLVGAPIAGRKARSTEGLIGFMLNTLALRGDLENDPTFRELLARVRSRTLRAYEHQDLPFERLIETLRPDARGDASLQVLFGLQNAPPARLELDGLETRTRPLETGQAHVELMLVVQRTGDAGEGASQRDGRLSAAWEYDTGLFETCEIEAFAASWRSFLEQAVRAPETRLSSLCLLEPAGRRRELERGRGPRRSYPRDQGLFELFERAASRSPDATAVEVGAERVSYQDLIAQAEAIAAALLAEGIRREELVALSSSRSDFHALAALGVLRADAAWLPLDPTQPDERVRRILSDAGVRIALCDLEEERERLEALGVRCMRIDRALAQGERGRGNLPVVRGHGGSLAYVMYTSGSTGEPKGVCVPQRAVARLVLDADYVDLRPGHRVARVSNTSFDAVTFELWGALLNGATLVDVDRETLLSPPALSAALLEREISHLLLTTAVFHQVARAAPRTFSRLQWLLFGGERCDPALVQAVLEAGAPRNLVHVYGPTETTTFASTQKVMARDGEQRGEPPACVPIGGPIVETDLYVLDGEMDPVPSGMAGELYIGGDGLARGYLGRGAASAASFVPDPFSQEPGARLYRTGDLVRWDANGCLEFIGRRDAQIKLRGFRIEPGEIEAALERCGDVQHAIVLLRRDPGGESHLVAWVLPRAGTRPSADQLRLELKERVPSYMLPSHFVFLDALPLGRTGKVDRRALPDPDWTARSEDPGLEAPASPENPLENVVASIWCGVLRLERVHPDDDFFELGGHSLLAAQVMSRLSEAIGSELPLRTLFEAPTVHELTERAAAARGAPCLPALPAREPGAREGPLSFAQHRLWFLQRLKPDSPFYNVPIALRIRGPLDADAWGRALVAFAARHEPLRTRIVSDGIEPKQVVDPPGRLLLTRCDLSSRAPHEREGALEQILRSECEQPIDLTSGPAWRASLIRLEPDHFAAAIVVHHAMTDGWSLGVMMKELGELYRSQLEGSASESAAEPRSSAVGYLEFARWQRERLRGEHGEARVAWWRARLAGAPQAIDLATDHPRPAVQTFRGSSVPCALPPELSRELCELARSEGSTPFMALLAGFLALLSRRSRELDLCIGTPVAGRDRPELEGLFGLFVDTLVLRTDLSGDPDFREILRRVRATVLEAFDHRDVPFEKVVEAARPERDTSRSPIFQVMFALQNAPLESPSLAGVEIETLQLASSTSKFDLTLALSEEAGSFAGVFEYDASLFERETVERMALSYQSLLRSALSDPGRRLSQLDWITSAERARVLELGRGPAGTAGLRLVHQMFERRAQENPQALAVESSGERLTYAELDERANRLAHRLRSLGVGPEVVVALGADRSPALIVGALAVMKAGGAYLPLDRLIPSERTLGMLADSRARALLVSSSPPEAQGPAPWEGFDGWIVNLDEVDLTGEPSSPPLCAASVESPAYIVYTSGSTGRPKGVVVPHRGLANLVDWHVRAYGIVPSDRATLLAGTSFDASVWEVWPYLAAGASLHVVPEDTRLDPVRLVEWMTQSSITVTFLPTPLGEAMLTIEWPRGASLRAMLVGGDRLHGPGSAPRAFALFNHYGPSEASVVTSACEVPPGAGAGLPPIGRPLDGVRVIVLDRNLEPAPLGVPGELYIGGAGLARGYLGKPRLTAEAFVPNPHADSPGERLYRAGDIVRWDGKGDLCFLGRADRQVKLFGLRLELGEVEALLCADPSVQEAVVVARFADREATGLVAYVVPRKSGVLDVRALSERLHRTLPHSLVPADWVELEALPKNTSGKVDRSALPQPRERAMEGAVAASTETEKRVAAVWGAVLRRSSVCCRTNFFDQGGTSLALLEVQAHLLKELGRDVPIVELFRHPSVESLSRWLDGETAQERPGSSRAEKRSRARARRQGD